MIPRVRLDRSGIVMSRLGFGTSRLHYLSSSRQRQAILAEAAAHGITHFDTAPLYGDGLAERELGRFLRQRRDEFTVATKVGIDPSWLIETAPSLALPWRGIRAVLRIAGTWNDRRPPLTVARLRSSLQRSLKRMRLDCVDVLLLHEPSPELLPNAEALIEELERLRAVGMIKHFGIAAPLQNVTGIVTNHPALARVMQTGERDWSEPGSITPDITFGAIALGRAQHYLRGTAVEPATAAGNLRAALARRPKGAVLVSTTNRAHLRLLAQTAAAAVS